MNELREAYDSCLALAQSHYENFPVASRLMPARLRPHVAAVYAFARIADDFADEPGRDVGDRLRLLKDWRSRLHQPGAGNRQPATANGSRHAAPGSRLPDPGQVFIALHDTIEQFSLPVSLFDDLLDAFMQDVTTHRYESWGAVLDYCRRSANPVGRLVLRLFGHNNDDLDRASDAVCTALQLTNFWQDLAVDWERGRLYVPEDIWRPGGADPLTLTSRTMTPEWAAVMRECGQRTQELFEKGRPVCDGVSGRLRYELRVTWLGGSRILTRLQSAGFDVFTARPKLGALDALVIAFGMLLWPETPPSPTRS